MTYLRCLGLLGGTSWQSTQYYYQALNLGVHRQLGGWYSAPLLLNSFNYAEVHRRQKAGAWEELGAMFAQAAQKLEDAGAQALLICANTMHKVAPAVEEAVSIPLIHLADVTAQALVEAGHAKAGLLGTCITMTENFYRQRLEAAGLEICLPEQECILELDRIIFDELVQGKFNELSRETFVQAMRQLHAQGASAMILGCTEIGLLIQAEHIELPLFDTLQLHVKAALQFMLAPPEA